MWFCYSALTLLLTGAASLYVDAFMVTPRNSIAIQRPTHGFAPVHVVTTTRLHAEEEDDDGKEEAAEEPTAEAFEGEEEKEKVDPEVEALQKEIHDLESQLSAKKKELALTQEQAERYSQTGYARRVAEVENMRRVRKVSYDS